MAHAFHHAESSARKFGGVPDDYTDIHTWFDATKATIAHPIHRALRHHAWGIFEAERLFGVTITNSDGVRVPVRLIAEQHVREDCGGRVPSVGDWLMNVNLQAWMLKGKIGDGYPDAEDGALGLDAWKAAVMEQRTILGYTEWRARCEGRPVPMPVLEIALAHLEPGVVDVILADRGRVRLALHALLADEEAGVLLHVPAEAGAPSAFASLDAILDLARERGAAMVYLSPLGEPAHGLSLFEEAAA